MINGVISVDKSEDKEIRYYIDLDLASHTIMGWDCGQRTQLKQTLDSPFTSRIFVSKGQFNKLMKAHDAVVKSSNK